MDLFSKTPSGFENAISPSLEMAAYEAIWSKSKASFKTIADSFRTSPDSKPSDFVSQDELTEYLDSIKEIINSLNQNSVQFGIRLHHDLNYPNKLRDAKNPVEVLYFQGDWNLVHERSIAVVGARNASIEGVKRAHKLGRLLAESGFVVVSGLAAGIDRAAHTGAIVGNGRTIGVLGTPLDQVYPRENESLQKFIGLNHLLISQVPFLRYRTQDYRLNRGFFPQRNITMSALTEATVIVEASDTSGTLYQARAALAQGRKLFILESCFNNPKIEWPRKYLKKGAIQVSNVEDIVSSLSS